MWTIKIWKFHDSLPKIPIKFYSYFLDCTVGKICVDCAQIPVDTAHRTCESLTKPVVSICLKIDICYQIDKCYSVHFLQVKFLIYIYRVMITDVSVAVIVRKAFLKIITVVVWPMKTVPVNSAGACIKLARAWWPTVKYGKNLSFGLDLGSHIFKK